MINYKTDDIDSKLKEHAPIHGFFDNTGGPAAAIIKSHMSDGGRVSKVGNIGGGKKIIHSFFTPLNLLKDLFMQTFGVAAHVMDIFTLLSSR